MNRKLVHDLIRLREARLREQTAKLKQAARGLTEIRDSARPGARARRRESIEAADTLAHSMSSANRASNSPSSRSRRKSRCAEWPKTSATHANSPTRLARPARNCGAPPG